MKKLTLKEVVEMTSSGSLVRIVERQGDVIFTTECICHKVPWNLVKRGLLVDSFDVVMNEYNMAVLVIRVSEGK